MKGSDSCKSRSRGVKRNVQYRESTGLCWSGSGGAITKNHPANNVRGRETMRARVRAGVAGALGWWRTRRLREGGASRLHYLWSCQSEGCLAFCPRKPLHRSCRPTSHSLSFGLLKRRAGGPQAPRWVSTTRMSPERGEFLM